MIFFCLRPKRNRNDGQIHKSDPQTKEHSTIYAARKRQRWLQRSWTLFFPGTRWLQPRAGWLLSQRPRRISWPRWAVVFSICGSPTYYLCDDYRYIFSFQADGVLTTMFVLSIRLGNLEDFEEFTLDCFRKALLNRTVKRPYLCFY